MPSTESGQWRSPQSRGETAPAGSDKTQSRSGHQLQQHDVIGDHDKKDFNREVGMKVKSECILKRRKIEDNIFRK